MHCGSRWSSNNENMLSRLRSSLATGIAQQKSGLLPKYIVVVLDDDLITFLDFKEEGVATLLGTWIKWLAKEFTSLIQERKDQVPKKSKGDGQPLFYWMAAPTHTCFSRERYALHVKFNLSLDSVIRANPSNMRVIKMKEGWNPKDSFLVVNDRMTDAGLSAYWDAVDASLKFNSHRRDLFMAKKLVQSCAKDAQPSASSSSETSHAEEKNRHHWEYDPMHSFFRRHGSHYAGRHRGDREDFGRNQQGDRFILPPFRLHHY